MSTTIIKKDHPGDNPKDFYDSFKEQMPDQGPRILSGERRSTSKVFKYSKPLMVECMWRRAEIEC